MTIHPEAPEGYRFAENVRKDRGARPCGGAAGCAVCAHESRPPVVHVTPPAGLRGVELRHLRDEMVAVYRRT